MVKNSIVLHLQLQDKEKCTQFEKKKMKKIKVTTVRAISDFLISLYLANII